jgi:hypothetical protein
MKGEEKGPLEITLATDNSKPVKISSGPVF